MHGRGLEGRTALVTGAGKRLGRAIALRLAREGADVVIHYRSSEDEAEATRGEIEELGSEAWTVQADLGEPAQAAELVSRAAAVAGPLGILINSASIFDTSSVDDVTFDQVTQNMAVNAWAPLELMRHFAAQDIDEGQIVNLLDTRVIGADPAHVAYIISKHALAQFTNLAALEYGPRIAVNAVAPGLVLPPPGKDESYLADLAGNLPLQRHGGAEDVADAAAYLVTARFVTGQVIYVDGGRHLRE